MGQAIGVVAISKRARSVGLQSGRDVGQARRLLAIAPGLDGASRAEEGKVGGMDRQTLRDWVTASTSMGPTA